MIPLRRCPCAPAPLVLSLFLLVGCSPDDRDGAGWSTERETSPSGTVLVHHRPPRTGIVATWRLEPDLRIGTIEGEGPDAFGRIADLAVHPDGRIVVLDGQAQEIRVFGPGGRHLRTFGRRGGGPGEFESANGVVFGPDTVLRVPDQQNARITFIDLDRGIVGSQPYQPLMFAGSWEGVVDSAGRTWSLHYRVGERDDDPGRMVYVALDTTGAVRDTIPGPWSPLRTGPDNRATWNVTTSDGRRASIGVPFYARQRYLLSPALRVWSTTEGDPGYRLTRWTPGVDTSLVIETDRPPQPVDMAEADSIARHYEERFGAPLDRSKIPEVAPAIKGMFVDQDGRLWVEVRTPEDDSLHTFDVYATDDGAWLGTLVTPLRIQTRPAPVVRGDRIWAVVLDPLDIPFVVRGRLGDADAVEDA